MQELGNFAQTDAPSRPYKSIAQKMKELEMKIKNLQGDSISSSSESFQDKEPLMNAIPLSSETHNGAKKVQFQLDQLKKKNVVPFFPAFWGGFSGY